MIILIYFLWPFLALVFIIVSSLYLLLMLDSLIRGHDLPTSRQAIRNICKLISQSKAGNANFYDLGCARGTLAIAIKRKLPQLSVYAMDKSSLRLFAAKLKAAFLGQKINFKKGNIFGADLRNADIIYTYLWYDLMPPLEKKLQKELKEGAMVITNTSNFPTWEPAKTIITHQEKPDFEKLFVYVKN